MEQDVIELKQNTPDGKYIIKKLPGRPKAGEVTLTRGLTADNSFEKWVKDSQFGKMGDARKGGAIIVYDYEGNADQALQADQRLAEEPGDRHAEGRRHQRADREAGRHLRAARGRVMRRSAAVGAPDAVAAAPEAARRRPSAASSALRTEFAFVLPRGYVDGAGTVHRDGVMRLATARDELVPLRDDRVRENPAYLTVVLLARVVTRIGTIDRRARRHHREPVRLGPGVPAGPLPAGQPGGPHPGRGRPARPASTSSRSTSPVVAWGNRDVRGRPALRGGRVRRLPLPLAARRDPRPGARRARRFVEEISRIDVRQNAGR